MENCISYKALHSLLQQAVTTGHHAACRKQVLFYPSLSGSLFFRTAAKKQCSFFRQGKNCWVQVGKTCAYATNTYKPSYNIGSYVLVGNQWAAGNLF